MTVPPKGSPSPFDATSLSVGIRGQASTQLLSDAIEAALVGAASGPIHVDEDAAEALFLQLNATISDPEQIDPAYALYIEVRRYLGRLYS